MTRFLKQSTAVDVVVGAFVDDTDGKTVETALTLSQADCQLSKNGGAVAQKNDATSATHLGGGHYKVPLNTTDTNTLGQLRLYINESGALPVWADFMVVTANIYDSLFSTDVFDVSVTQIAGAAVSTSTAQLGVNAVQAGGTAWGSGAITAASIATDAITAAKIAADAIGASELAADAVNEIADQVWDELLSGHTTAGSGGKTLADAATAAALDAVDNFVDTEVAAILAAVDTEVAAIKAKTDNLPAAPAATGDIPTAAAVADAVWDEAIAGHVAAGSFGEETQAHATPAEVNAQVLDVLTVDTFAEASGVPAATSTLKDKINWLFILARNKRTTTATADKVRNDADSADVGTATLSDDGTTFTRGEYA